METAVEAVGELGQVASDVGRATGMSRCRRWRAGRCPARCSPKPVRGWSRRPWRRRSPAAGARSRRLARSGRKPARHCARPCLAARAGAPSTRSRACGSHAPASSAAFAGGPLRSLGPSPRRGSCARPRARSRIVCINLCLSSQVPSARWQLGVGQDGVSGERGLVLAAGALQDLAGAQRAMLVVAAGRTLQAMRPVRSEQRAGELPLAAEALEEGH